MSESNQSAGGRPNASQTYAGFPHPGPIDPLMEFGLPSNSDIGHPENWTYDVETSIAEEYLPFATPCCNGYSVGFDRALDAFTPPLDINHLQTWARSTDAAWSSAMHIMQSSSTVSNEALLSRSRPMYDVPDAPAPGAHSWPSSATQSQSSFMQTLSSNSPSWTSLTSDGPPETISDRSADSKELIDERREAKRRRRSHPARRARLCDETRQTCQTTSAPGTTKGADKFLLDCRKAEIPFKVIKYLGGFTVAESTLRGRHRNLTKRKEYRVRKPVWSEKDDELLLAAVRRHSGFTGEWREFERWTGRTKPSKMPRKIAWQEVAAYISANGGYKFGNATCKKRFDSLIGSFRVNAQRGRVSSPVNN
ncbi:MAG: hypothetical protein M4579_001640 [Chaenotheca gracillima]|nr:MAG: hypothetical protein M4579_001640 [Chaenotheca gracillima]